VTCVTLWNKRVHTRLSSCGGEKSCLEAIYIHIHMSMYVHNRGANKTGSNYNGNQNHHHQIHNRVGRAGSTSCLRGRQELSHMWINIIFPKGKRFIPLCKNLASFHHEIFVRIVGKI